MIDEQLQEDAALYAANALDADARIQFELLLPFHPDLAALTAGLAETAASVVLAATPAATMRPAETLRASIFAKVAEAPQQTQHDALVMAGPDALVEHVTAEFTEMCGYSLEELRGKKLGPILQGELTDRAVAEHMRQAVHEQRPCAERLINYHKDGTPYLVAIEITPIFKRDGSLRCYVAREREVAQQSAA